MGFLDGLVRFIAGKPVFVDQNSAPSSSQTGVQSVDPNKTPVDASGYKIIPKIEIAHLQTARNGDTMMTEAWLNNQSDEAIRLDSVEVCGKKTILNHQLAPHQGHQFVIYTGPVMRDNDHYIARLVYRLIRSDDLFQEDYYVKFTYESDGAYIIDEFHQNGPTRDI